MTFPSKSSLIISTDLLLPPDPPVTMIPYIVFVLVVVVLAKVVVDVFEVLDVVEPLLVETEASVVVVGLVLGLSCIVVTTTPLRKMKLNSIKNPLGY